MIENPQKQKPNKWLDLDNCYLCYVTYLDVSKELQILGDLPSFDTRYPGKLESILGSVKQTFAGNYLNNSIVDAYVSYFYQIIKGHPFIDGNKRMSVLFSHIFLLHNGYDVANKFDYAQMYDIAIKIAESTDERLARKEIKEIILKNIKSL